MADKEVALQHTGAFGCTTKWSDKEATNVAFVEKLNTQQPISLDMAFVATLKSLHTNAGGNVLYKTVQPVDVLKLRRTVLANLPSAYIGLNNSWLGK